MSIQPFNFAPGNFSAAPLPFSCTFSPAFAPDLTPNFLSSLPKWETYNELSTWYCTEFTEKFPHKVQQVKEKVGTIGAIGKTVGYYFSNIFGRDLNKAQPIGSAKEHFDCEYDRALLHANDIGNTLDFMENILAESGLSSVEMDRAQAQIREIRQNPVLYSHECRPQLSQGMEAVSAWRGQLDLVQQKVDYVFEQVASLAKKNVAADVACDQFTSMLEHVQKEKVPLEFLVSILSEQMGTQLPLQLPGAGQTIEYLRQLMAPVPEPQMLEDLSIAASFHAEIFEACKSEVQTYALKRFVKGQHEYDDLIKRWSETLKGKIADILSDPKVKKFVIPGQIANDPEKMDLKMPADMLQIPTAQTKSYLLHVEKLSKGKINLRLYFNDPNMIQKQPKRESGAASHYVEWSHLDQKYLLDPGLLSTIIKKALGMQPLPPLEELSWMPTFENIKANFGKRFKEFANSLSHTMMSALGVNFVNNRALSFLETLESSLGKGVVVKLDNQPKIAEKFPDNHWGLWESLWYSKDKYERAFDVKLVNIVRLDKAFDKQSPTVELQLNMLDMGVRRMFALAHNLHHAHLITDAKLQYTVDILNQIGIRLHKHKSDFERALLEKSQDVVSTNPLPIDTCQKVIALPDALPPYSAIQRHVGAFKIITNFQNWTPTALSVGTLANQAEQAYQQANYNGIIHAVREFYRRFNFESLPTSFWDQLTEKEAQDTLVAFEKLNKLYFKSYFDADVARMPDTESGLMMIEGLALSDRLMSKIPDFKKYTMPLDKVFAYVFNRRVFFRTRDGQLDRRLLAARKYYEHFVQHRANIADDYAYMLGEQTRWKPLYQSLFHSYLGRIPKENIYLRLFGKYFQDPRISFDVLLFYNDAGLSSYLQDHLDDFDRKHFSRLSDREKMEKMLTGEIADVLPPSFYALRNMAQIADYFFYGLFIKPATFKRQPDSFDVSYESHELASPVLVDMFSGVMNPGMSALGIVFPNSPPRVRKNYEFDVRDMIPSHTTVEVKGMDQSVFVENPTLPDGYVKGHQYNHQGPVSDSVLKAVYDQSLVPVIKKNDDLTSFSSHFSPNSRDDNYYPGITDEGRAVYDLNTVIVRNLDEVKKYLTKQDMEILLSLRGLPPVQIANTLTFFRQRTHLLEKADMQTHLFNLLFDPPLLMDELSRYPRNLELIKQLADFIGNQYTIYSNQQNSRMTAFYLEFAVRINNYITAAKEGYPIAYDQVDLPEFFKNVETLLKNVEVATLNPDYRGVRSGCLALSIVGQRRLNSVNDVKDFLQNVFLYHRFPPPSADFKQGMKEDLGRVLWKYSSEIQRFLSQASSEDIVEILKGVYQLPQGVQLDVNKDNPWIYSLRDGSVTIDFLQGMVISENFDSTALPVDVVNSHVYLANFGAQEYRCKALTQSTFEFTDRTGYRNRVSREPSGNYVLHRQFPKHPGRWYQFVPKHLLSNDQTNNASEKKLQEYLPSAEHQVPSRTFIEGYTHWSSFASPSEMLLLNADGKPAFRIELYGSEAIRQIDKNTVLKAVYSLDVQGKDALKLTNIYSDSPLFSWVRNLEDPSHVRVWKHPKTNQPEMIEFTRFGDQGLVFEREGNVFMSKQFPGYFIKTRQVNPMVDRCENFIVLQNQQGAEKLIVAQQEIQQSWMMMSASSLKFQRQTFANGVKHRLAVYDRPKGDKAFSSQGRDANFYQAMILAAKKRYGEAISLMRAYGSASSLFLKHELTSLEWIANLDKTVSDDSPGMIAVTLLAQIIKARNLKDQENHSPKPLNDSKEIANLGNSIKVDLVQKYFAIASLLGHARLSPDEEYFALQAAGLITPNLQPYLETCLLNDQSKARDLLLTLGRGEKVIPDICVAINNQERLMQGSSGLPSSSTACPVIDLSQTGIEAVPHSAQNQVNPQALEQLFDPKGKPAIVQRAFEFYRTDCQAHLKSQRGNDYKLVNPESFSKSRQQLQKTHQYWKEALAQAELDILRLAAKPSNDPLEHAKQTARLRGNLNTHYNLNDLIYHYMHHQLNPSMLGNPNLDENDIRMLDRLIDVYLDLSISNAQRKAVIDRQLDVEHLTNLSGDHPALSEAIKAFVEQVEATRHYDPARLRFLKVFEHYSGFYLRENQIKSLSKLGVPISNTDGPGIDSIMIELIVGSGKTTALMPTKGFWSADGKHLSMAVMPPSLISNMSREVERIMGKAFAMKVHRLQFSRKTQLDAGKLKSILDDLHQIIERREYLIMTDKSLKSFVNQFVIVLHETFTGKDAKTMEKAELMRQILTILLDKAEAVGDEADQLLHPRIELNFPSGEQRPVQEKYIATISKLYEFLVSPQITKIANFEFLPKASGAAECTPEIYKKNVKPALAKQMLSFLEKALTADDADAFGPLQKFYLTCSETQKQALLDYLLDNENDASTEKWLRAEANQEVRDLIGLIRGELNVLLPLTLSKNYGERYGFHTPEAVVADPFQASNAPSFGSRFSNPFERINYSIQAHYNQGINKLVVERLIHDLQGRAIKEIREHIDDVKKLKPGELYITKAHREFDELSKGSHIKLFDADVVDRMTAFVKDKNTAVFNLLKKYVLPQITVFDQNLKATSQTLAYLISHFKGFTGTLWNSATFHNKITPDFQTGARGKLINLVYSQVKGTNGQADKIHILSATNPRQIHKEVLIDNQQLRHINVIIDAGGALKRVEMGQAAKDWLDHCSKENPKIRGAVFLSQAGDEMIWEKDQPAPVPLSKSTCAVDERVTLYDQKSTVGVNIRQAVDSVALVTISKGMTMRDFIQAAGRMRGLGAGQRVEIGLTGADAAYIREVMQLQPEALLTIDDLLRFLVVNEVERQVDDNQVATSHKLKAALQEWFLRKLAKAKSIQAVSEEFTHPEFIERLFFQKHVLSPFEAYGLNTELISAKIAYDEEIDKILDPSLRQIISDDVFLNGNQKNMTSELEALLKGIVKLDVLPEKVRRAEAVTDVEEEQEVEIQQEVTQEVEQEQEQEQVQEKGIELTPCPHEKLHLIPEWILSSKYFEAGEVNLQTVASNLSRHPKIGKLEKFFDPNLKMSKNLLYHTFAYKDKFKTYALPYDRYHKELQNILIYQDSESKFHVVLLDAFDAAAYKLTLQELEGNVRSADPDLKIDYWAERNEWESTRRRLSKWDRYNYASMYYWLQDQKYQLDERLKHRQMFFAKILNKLYFFPGSVSLNDKRDLADLKESKLEYWWEREKIQDLKKRGLSEVNLDHFKKDLKIWIGDLDLNGVYEGPDQISKNTLENDPEVARLLVQAKFYDGYVHYTSKELGILTSCVQAYLKKVLPKAVDKAASIAALDELEKLYREVVLAYKEQSKRDYAKSELKDLFDALRQEAAA